ncbi:response regulator receiver domain [Vibrio fluvialis]|uniref:response regulator receiver domain n=1 Tax=Vibrio fluvialis TaxID=676 RepID=UPI0028F709C3|nr:response regulator receiver domain [Vibrio fluvialis]
MPELYRNKIVEAFRDNAIRSVLLIDDEYLPFEKLVSAHTSFQEDLKLISNDPQAGIEKVEAVYQAKLSHLRTMLEQASGSLMRSEVAKGFVSFFHNKKLVCDVEDGTEMLDRDKVRKSDLIVLDYYLQSPDVTANPAEFSLKLIDELSESKHMNIVVVYTKEDLDSVWFEVATTLRGSHENNEADFFSNQALTRAWQNNHKDWEDEWVHIGSKDVYDKFLKSEHDIAALTQDLQDVCDEKGLDSPKTKHVEWLLEQSIRGYNKNSCPISNFEIHGQRKKWLQAGDVFVVFCSKDTVDGDTVRDTSPEEVWALIQETLIDWYPSFYRVVTSEIQNHIEDANLSMEKVLSAGTTEQIAALWGVLRVEDSQRERASKELLNQLLTDVVDKIQNSSELLKFIKQTANSVDEQLPLFVSEKNDRSKYHSYLKKMVLAASKNLKVPVEQIDQKFRGHVVHAFNEQLSIEKELPDHISTGVILKDIVEGSYYLCIAPSCNTVPNQTTGKVADRMKPHRPMRFIRMADVSDKLLDKLKVAHQSDVIFLTDENNRLALGVYESNDVPTIEQGVVVHHDTALIAKGETKDVQFLTTNPATSLLEVETRKFKLVAKLRPGFASRYQNYQIQYEARIGVDLVSANMK